MESGHNSYGILVYVPIIFFLLSFFSFVFSSFNVIATPLLRFVSRIKIFVDEFRRETKRFIIYSNKLRIGTNLSSLSSFSNRIS